MAPNGLLTRKVLTSQDSLEKFACAAFSSTSTIPRKIQSGELYVHFGGAKEDFDFLHKKQHDTTLVLGVGAPRLRLEGPQVVTHRDIAKSQFVSQFKQSHGTDDRLIKNK